MPPLTRLIQLKPGGREDRVGLHLAVDRHRLVVAHSLARIDADHLLRRILLAFRLLTGEGAAIVKLCQNPGNVMAGGVTVVGVKCVGSKGDSRTIIAMRSATGVVLAKTGQCVVIGRWDEMQKPGDAQLTVEKRADYLIANGC